MIEPHSRDAMLTPWF